MPRANGWASRFGAARRRLDSQYLADAEASIDAEEERRSSAPRIEALAPSWLETQMIDQLAFEKEKRAWLDRGKR